MKAVALVAGSLDRLYVFCLKALRAFGDRELDRLAFLQAAKSVRSNCRKMHEDIIAGLAADEAEALRVIKPFHCSLFHCVPVSMFEISAEKNRCE